MGAPLKWGPCANGSYGSMDDTALVLRKPLDDKGAELGDVSTSIWIFLNLPSLCIGMPKTDGVLS